ncbi:regulator of chromosome condensation 1/beta-lactamase-inhibitor protein II [Phycomyces nitens]|nr:regulator of chromosome condensation 1/beta-lactamase-inhibitor protein II [Phycomyces nitens]
MRPFVQRSTQAVRSVHTLGTKSVYGWGQTQALPLHFDEERDDVYTTPVRLDTLPDYAIDKSQAISHIAAGWAHSLIGTQSHVYGFGLNRSGQLGHAPDTSITMALGQSKLKHLACGREHSHIVTEESRSTSLYSFGNSMYGQLGVGKSKYSRPGTLVSEESPVKVQGYQGKVTDIVCGLDHTIFSTDHSSIYAMGWGSDGQLGLGLSFTGDKDVPSLLPPFGDSKIKLLSGSTDFTLMLTEDNVLWTWGNSEYGQGIQGKKIDRITEPIKVSVKGVKDIAAGGPFSVILTEDGRVHSCGYGALGHGKDTIESLVLREIEGLKDVERIFATTDYAAAITGSGELFTWGLNGPSSRLGLTSVDHAFVPKRVNIDKPVSDIALGTNHVLALCD